MTLETCRIQYEIAKSKNDKSEMEFWADKAKMHGGSVEEEKPKSKEKK